MHIREVIERTGIVERQIRYLIAEGLIPPPRGGRANADYGDDHVATIHRYQSLKDLGFPPSAIKLLLDAHQGVPFPIAPGITLVIDPDLLGSGLEAAPLADKINALLLTLLKEPDHGQDRNPAND